MGQPLRLVDCDNASQRAAYIVYQASVVNADLFMMQMHPAERYEHAKARAGDSPMKQR